MIRSILIDDEKSSLESLEFELKTYCPQVEVVSTFSNPKTALDKIVSLKPDLVFLDIEMPGMTGFDFLQKIPEIFFHVIFVTAYDQFALRAFEFNATDYLMKPIRKEKLTDAVKKVKDRLDQNIDRDQLLALMQNIYLQQNPQSQLNKIALPVGEGFNMVKVEDIVFLLADSNYTWVNMKGGEKYFISKTLKEIESLLKSPNFYRSHKSYLINLNHIDKYIRGQGGYLITEEGEQIPVSRAQKPELLALLKGQKGWNIG